MERVEIQTSLTQADWHAYQVHWTERNLGDQRKQGLIAVLLGALTVIVAASLADYFDRPLSMPSLLAGIVLATAGIVLQRISREALRSSGSRWLRARAFLDRAQRHGH